MTAMRYVRSSLAGPTASKTEPPSQVGVRLTLRARQKISLGDAAPDHVFLIEDGCLMVDAVLSEQRRQGLLVLYQGDVIKRSAVAHAVGASLTALLPSTVLRLLPGESATIEAGGRPIDVESAMAALLSRQSLHLLTIALLNGEQRIATLMLELALHLGHPVGDAWSFRLPMSRREMAEHLALNPDTLSRLLSRLRASGLLTMPTRSVARIEDMAALEAATPLAAAMRGCHRAAVGSTG